MRAEVWVHEATGTTFTGRHLYLDFMRNRRRDRMALARMQKYQANAWETLEKISAVLSFRDIEEFLNDHHREIDAICSNRHHRHVLNAWIRIKHIPAKDTETHWMAAITYQYGKEKTSGQHRNHSWPSYGVSDVLRKLGMEMGSGGGDNGRMTFPRAMISKEYYHFANVLEILAA